MVPAIVLVVVTLLLRVVGRVAVQRLDGWRPALRGGLAAMFLLTGISHFGASRDDFIAMVPPFLPLPDMLVTVTGMLELTGALGLLHRKTTPAAAAGLSALLIFMFPANVHAALDGLSFDGTAAMELLPRTLLQLAFLVATLSVSTAGLRLSRVLATATHRRRASHFPRLSECRSAC